MDCRSKWPIDYSPVCGRIQYREYLRPRPIRPRWPTPSVFLSDDFLRLTGTSTKNGVTRYVFSEFFQIQQGQTYSIGDLTFTDIPPRKPESLSIVLSNRTAFIGQNLPLTVLARFADGSTTNVASKASWTSYRVSNPNIATVSPDGVVTSLKPGVVYVTVVNEGVATTCGLNIVTGTDGLTTVVGTVVDTKACLSRAPRFGFMI